MAVFVQKHKIPTILLLIIIIISSNFILSHQRIPDIKSTKTTNIQFYFHDTVSGSNPTAVNVIPVKSKYRSTNFGAMFMVDNPLTVGPDKSSKLIGRAQGFYAGEDMGTIALLMVMNIVFTEDSEFSGSTLSVMGRNPVLETVREPVSIVGGTGVFRFARGFARARTYSDNPPDAVVGYNVTVYHYN